MIEIMCEGGCVLAGVCMPYPVMCHLLQDSVIPEDGFVELDFMDGTRGLIRKKSIIGFYETEKKMGENCTVCIGGCDIGCGGIYMSA